MPLEIRGAHFLIRSAQLVRGTRLEYALVSTQRTMDVYETSLSTTEKLYRETLHTVTEACSPRVNCCTTRHDMRPDV